MKPTNPPPPPPPNVPDYDDGVPHHQPGVHDEMHNIDVAHEHVDVNLRAVIGSAAALTVVTAASFVLMYALFWGFERNALAKKSDVSPLAPPATQMPGHITGPAPFGSAPAPQLLTDESAALQQHRAREADQLSTYGWVNQQGGVARMPIAEAKKLILERGLPARETVATKDPTVGTIRPAAADASSGRTADGPPRGAGLPPVSGPSPQPQQPAAGTRHKGH